MMEWKFNMKRTLLAASLAVLPFVVVGQDLSPQTIVIRGGFDNIELPAPGAHEIVPQDQAVTRTPSNRHIGPIRDPKTGIRGALINNEGDSQETIERMRVRRALIAAQQDEAWPTPEQPIQGVYQKDKNWYSNNYYSEHEDTTRVRLDAWTHVYGQLPGSDTIVLSCVYDMDSRTGSNLKFFLKTNLPINKFGAEVPVSIVIDNTDPIRTIGTVSTRYVGNLHIEIPTDTAAYMFERMRAAQNFRIQFQPVAAVRPYSQMFSLHGFTAASANTITNCVDNL